MNSKKRKERKQMITFGVSVLVILVLVVVYAVIMNGINGGDGEDTDTELELMDIGTFTIIEENYSMLTKLSYTHNDKTVSLEVKNGKWTLSEDEYFPLDMQKVMYMAQSISDYGGFRRLAYNEANRGTYGFDDPEYDISAMYYKSDGETTYTRRYLFGNKNELTGYYYFYEEGSSYVYMVSSAIFEYFNYTKADLFAGDSMPGPKLEDIDSMTVTLKGKDPLPLEIPEAAAEKNEDGTINYSPVELIMDTLFFDVKLNYKSHVDYDVTESELSEYGLAEPELTISMEYRSYESVSTEEGTSGAQITRDNKFTIYFGAKDTITVTDAEGNESENEIVYVTVEGSEIVYAVDVEDYTAIAAAVPAE